MPHYGDVPAAAPGSTLRDSAAALDSGSQGATESRWPKLDRSLTGPVHTERPARSAAWDHREQSLAPGVHGPRRTRRERIRFALAPDALTEEAWCLAHAEPSRRAVLPAHTPFATLPAPNRNTTTPTILKTVAASLPPADTDPERGSIHVPLPESPGL